MYLDRRKFMRYIRRIILLVLCLSLLLLTDCMKNQEDIYQSSNNFQSSSTGSVEEPVIEEDTEATVTVYPQKWATGTGTVGDPWTNDCIKKAYDAVPAGGTIFLRAGYYLVSATIGNAWAQTKSFNLIGEGIGKSIIILDTGNTDGIAIHTADYCTLKGFTIDANCQENSTRPAISIYNCNYTIVEDVEAKNAGTFGIDPAESSYSYFHNIYAHDNYSHGIHPGAEIQGRNTNNVYRDIYCYSNGDIGFADYGYAAGWDINNNVYDKLQCWDNGHSGISMMHLNGCVLSNSSASGNGKNGIWLWNSEDINVHDCFITLSGGTGITVNVLDNISFVNVISKNNNGEAGISINDSNELRFTSCQSYDDRDTPLQQYGIQLTETNTGISLSNCKLSPNATAEIYNPAGTVLTVIAEK